MRILYIDCDSLRPDHLGCYGYHRKTSPNIDRIANEGRRFTNYYVSDAPCLPSRTAFFTGRFGIHTGVINHGGLAADPRPIGRGRGFNTDDEFRTFVTELRNNGYDTALVSPFPTRHGAWHVLDGFETWHDTGGSGRESADIVYPYAEQWLDKHAREEDWYLHVNFWDPHAPYDTPMMYGDPFADDSISEWLTEERLQQHRESYGMISARDTIWFHERRNTPRTPDEIVSLEDFKQWIDGYDTGIRYMDDYIGHILDLLDAEGVLDTTLVIVSADHGENQGELNVYGDHETADHWTCRVPLVMRGPDIEPGIDNDLHYHLDLGPTLVDLIDGDPAPRWDGQSFASSVTGGANAARKFLVTGHGAHTCQRGVYWNDWLLLRTYHDGIKDLSPVELYDLSADPHETEDLSEERPNITAEGLHLLESWHTSRMKEAAEGERGGNPDAPNGTADPLWTVIEEGGPFHTVRGFDLDQYVERLRETGREQHAETVAQQYC